MPGPNPKIIYEVDAEVLGGVIDAKLESLAREGVLGRYRGRLVSAGAVAEIHGIHRDTVVSYAKAGLIPGSEKGARLWRFDLAEALAIDFSALRRRK